MGTTTGGLRGVISRLDYSSYHRPSYRLAEHSFAGGRQEVE